MNKDQVVLSIFQNAMDMAKLIMGMNVPSTIPPSDPIARRRREAEESMKPATEGPEIMVPPGLAEEDAPPLQRPQMRPKATK